jgi:hypothetical protein
MEVNAKAAAWRRVSATTGVQPNRENVIQEAFRREIASQEAQQQGVSVTLAAPPVVLVGKVVPRQDDSPVMTLYYFTTTSSQKSGSFLKNRS